MGLSFAIATVLHTMLNRYLLKVDTMRKDLDVGFRGLDAMLAFIDEFEGALAMLDLPNAAVERRVKINSDIVILDFIDKAHRKHMEQLLFQIRKRAVFSQSSARRPKSSGTYSMYDSLKSTGYTVY